MGVVFRNLLTVSGLWVVGLRVLGLVISWIRARSLGRHPLTTELNGVVSLPFRFTVDRMHLGARNILMESSGGGQGQVDSRVSMFQSFRHSFRQRGLSLDLGLKSVEGLSLEVWKVHPLDLEIRGVCHFL